MLDNDLLIIREEKRKKKEITGEELIIPQSRGNPQCLAKLPCSSYKIEEVFIPSMKVVYVLNSKEEIKYILINKYQCFQLLIFFFLS